MSTGELLLAFRAEEKCCLARLRIDSSRNTVRTGWEPKGRVFVNRSSDRYIDYQLSGEQEGNFDLRQEVQVRDSEV